MIVHCNNACLHEETIDGQSKPNKIHLCKVASCKEECFVTKTRNNNWNSQNKLPLPFAWKQNFSEHFVTNLIPMPPTTCYMVFLALTVLELLKRRICLWSTKFKMSETMLDIVWDKHVKHLLSIPASRPNWRRKQVVVWIYTETCLRICSLVHLDETLSYCSSPWYS